jgi:uncharacterized membrane protein
MKRIYSIDLIRGLVMLIMAIDHSRDLLHVDALTQDPTNLTTTTIGLFMTRWITHLCAPTFVFLSGVSAYLSFKSLNNTTESRRFLLTRGIWLVVLEFTIISFGIWFDILFRTFLFQVIAAIGFGFIILSFLLRFSPKTLGITGLIIIFGHNLLPIIPLDNLSILKSIVNFFFSFSFIQITPNTSLIINYPIVPWLGIMLAGFGFGGVFELDEAKRKSILLKVGFGAILLFILIRFTNFYGDSALWSPQKDTIFTFLSFINLTKYPPSLLYVLVTLGITITLMGLTEGTNNKITQIISTYGKVPLFYYIIHWYIIHLIMLIMVFWQGFKWDDLNFGTFGFGRPQSGSGVQLSVVYLIWFIVILILYPLCKWYAKYKSEHRDNKLLRYL